MGWHCSVIVTFLEIVIVLMHCDTLWFNIVSHLTLPSEVKMPEFGARVTAVSHCMRYLFVSAQCNKIGS